jgi:ABC-type sugar transport system substrate-binding protein
MFVVIRGARLLAISATLAVLANGCGGDDKSSSQSARDVRLAAVIKGLDNPFFMTMRDGLVATARRDHAQLGVAAAPSGLQDTAGQASKLVSLAANRRDCFIVNPINQINLVQALARVSAGTPIVNLDSPVDKDAAGAVGVKITTHIGTDNVAGGKLGADAMAALVDRGSRVAVIAGIPGDVSSGGRAEGFRKGARGRFDVVETIPADYERSKARLAAKELLSAQSDINGIFAVNDLMALGVADAVREAGRRGKVAVVGFDGIREALAAVRSGALSATVSQYPYSIGRLGVEACLGAVRGKSVPANVDAPVQVVTKKNVARAQANFPRPVEKFDDPLAGLLEE